MLVCAFANQSASERLNKYMSDGAAFSFFMSMMAARAGYSWPVFQRPAFGLRKRAEVGAPVRCGGRSQASVRCSSGRWDSRRQVRACAAGIPAVGVFQRAAQDHARMRTR